MRVWRFVLVAVVAGVAVAAQKADRGLRLGHVSWWDAASALTADAVVVIPAGAGAKQHGPHLQLETDLAIAEYLARRVTDAAAVVVAPPLAYDHDPAFLEYPGSASLAADAVRDLTAEAARSIARHGPRRFYVLTAGASTTRPYQAAATALERDGILLRHLDYASALDEAARKVRQQPGGTHADEIETSLMLHIAPQTVDMKRAVKEYYATDASSAFRLTRQRGVDGLYSPSGIWGDPTLATAQKGAVVAEALVKKILADLAALAAATPPAPSSQTQSAPPPRSSTAAPPPPPGECTPGDQRTIRAVGAAFTYRWANADAEELSKLWMAAGDIIHPDGTVERYREVIMTNRRELFARREYRGSKHPLTLMMVRCPEYNIAIADGRWQMIGVRDASGKELPPYDGQATLIMKRSGDAWLIEAYRYTMKPTTEAPPPIFLKRPGWPDKK